MPRALATAAAAAAALLLSGVAARAPPSLTGGATFFGADTASTFALANEEGTFRNSFNLVRRKLLWGDIERAKGVYNWSATDSVVAIASGDAFIDALWLTLTGVNPLYDGGAAPTSAAAVGAYVAFATAAAKRYGSNVSAVECWDAPNDAASWPPAPSAAAYAALCAAAGAAVRAAAPSVAVVGLSAAPAADGSGLDTAFISGALSGPAGSALQAGLTGVAVSLGRWDAASGDLAPPEACAPDVAALRALLQKYAPAGGAPLPVVAVGHGYASDDVSDDGQAKWAGRSYLHAMALGVNVTLWRGWRDGDGCNATVGGAATASTGCTYGVVHGVYQNASMPYIRKSGAYAAGAALQGLGSQCAYVGTLAVTASGSVPGGATNVTAPCYAQYYDCGFLTPAFDAWCVPPAAGWTTSLTFPYDPPAALLSRGTAAAVPQAELLPARAAPDVRGVCYWPLNYQGFQQGGLICSGGDPLSWTIDNMADGVWFLVAEVWGATRAKQGQQ